MAPPIAEGAAAPSPPKRVIRFVDAETQLVTYGEPVLSQVRFIALPLRQI